jgi:mannitol/fructose-specific phosphotransferase system IIA component (Ntr-type)
MEMELDYFLPKTQVVKVTSLEKQLVIKELVEKLQDLGLIENKERYYAQIIHRESLENTGIGNGLAIPHARTESINGFVSILGICEKLIDYQSIDCKPVKFILLSLFPTDMSTKYLYLIGMMARIFSNIEKNEILSGEKSAAKFYTMLKKESKSYFEAISEKGAREPSAQMSLAGVPSSNLDLLIRLDRLYTLLDEGGKSSSLNQKVEDLRKLIDNRSLTYYERMKKKKSNPFSIVEKNSCSGCHMEIPPLQIQKIKVHEDISLCTHCGRFLILI